MINFIFGTDIVKWYDCNRWFEERWANYTIRLKNIKIVQVDYQDESYTTFTF